MVDFVKTMINLFIFSIFLTMFVVSIVLYTKLATDCMTCDNAKGLHTISLTYALIMLGVTLLWFGYIAYAFFYSKDDTAKTPML